MKIALILILLPGSVLAQGFSISKKYSPKEYVGNLQVWEASQDTNQFLFFGHGSGLSIYDGKNWISHHVGYSGRVRSIFRSSENQLYLSGQYDYGYATNDFLNRFKIKSLRKDNEELYNDVYNEHLKAFEINQSKYFYGSKGLEKVVNDSVSFYPFYSSDGIAFNFDNKIYVNNYFGIHEVRNGRFFYVEESNQFEGDRLNFAISLDNNKILLGFGEAGLITFDGKSFQNFNEKLNQNLKGYTPYDAIHISDSLIAIGTVRGGLFIVTNNGKIEKAYNQRSGFSENGILGVYQDHELTLWLLLWGGIEKKILSNPIFSYGDPSEIDFEVIKVFSFKEKVVIASTSGIYVSQKIEPENFLKFKKLASISSANTKAYAFNKDLYLLIKNEIFSSEDLSNSIFNEDDDLLIFLDNQDSPHKVSVLGSKGVYVENGQGFKFLKIDHSLTGVQEGLLKNGQVVLRTLEGIYFSRDSSLVRISISEEIDSRAFVNQIGVIANSIYLAIQGPGSSGGMYRFDLESEQLYKEQRFGDFDDDITDLQILSFDQCNNGDVWFFADKRVLRFKEAGGNVSLNKSPYQLIGGGDAIYDIECADDGSVWFGGVNGLYHLTDPDWEYKTEFKTNITDIYVNRDSLIYGGFGEPAKPIVLSYEDNEVRFNYAAASYIDETRNTYSVKLEGFDNDWSEWSLETQKDYTNIPEGDYIFKVRSRNVYEVDGKPDQIAFTVLPPWYRTWWAYMLYFISFSGLLYTGYKIRVNQLLKVERMRTKIASDLHDEVSATLTGISYFAEAIKRDKDQSKAPHFVSLISESAGDAKEKITDIVWSINPDNDSWELFLSKCRRFASDLLESKELEYTLKITEHIPGKLNMETRQHLWMIFKEMVTNAVRHSKATRLDVIMDVENGTLKLIVQDNGIGFDLDEIREGNGVRNIKKRAAKIGATIKMHSEEDFGTRWRMELPL